MKPGAFLRFHFPQAAPFLFLVLHYLVLNTAARLRLLWFLHTVDPEQTLYNRLDPEAMQAAMLHADVQNYASFYMALILIPLYALYLWYRRRTDRSIIRLNPIRTKDVLASLSTIVGTLGAVTLWMTLLFFLGERFTWLAGLLDDYARLAGTFAPESSSLFFMFLNIVVLVPVAEELLFRGIVQGEFSLAMPRSRAIALTLVLFSLFHINPIQISYVVLPAFMLSYVYSLTQNFLVPVLMHMLFNFLGSGLFTAVAGIRAEIQIIVQWLFIGLGAAALAYLIRKDKSARKTAPPAQEDDLENADYQ